MFNKIAELTGSGWKTYTSAIGLMLYAVVLGIDAVGVDIIPQEATLDQAFTTFMLGLAAFGIRDKLQKG